MMLRNVARVGRAALWIYTCHILVWTIGVICGVFETFAILIALGWHP